MSDHDETTEITGERPAAAGSPLGSLRARREQKIAKLFKDIEVPRWDEVGPPVFVRFKPVADERVTAITKRFEKSKDRNKDVIVNALILSEGCVGVYQLIEKKLVSIDEGNAPPTFNERLAELLGLDDTSGGVVDIARALYFTDGDLLGCSSKLAEWSGYTLDETDREIEGN